jgi:hypothetical protein
VPEVAFAIAHCDNFVVAKNGDMGGIKGDNAACVDDWCYTT